LRSLAVVAARQINIRFAEGAVAFVEQSHHPLGEVGYD
jgi:hypothetical protein